MSCTKRKSSRPASSEFVWDWIVRKRRRTGPASKLRAFAQGPEFDDDNDEIISTKSKSIENIQLELFLRKGPEYRCYSPLPYDMLVKIFHDVVKISDNPIKDLYNISRVWETFRILVISNLNYLWFRLDLSSIPMTDNNIRSLDKILFADKEMPSPLIEFTIDGQAAKSGHDLAYGFMERVLKSPKLECLTLKNVKPTCKQATKLFRVLQKSLTSCKKLRSLTITDASPLFGNTKWLSDFLNQGFGKHLENLDLSLSMTVISAVLQRSICNVDNCPNLKVLDLTTSDRILSNSFDIAQLALNAPNLEVFRAGNVSFKRVTNPPIVFHFTKLRELSIPIARRDPDRDDALYSSIAYGSTDIRLLDIRGSMISAYAIVATPSMKLRELHMDDICPISRTQYGSIIRRWRGSLEILSLVKICCTQTVTDCLDSLFHTDDITDYGVCEDNKSTLSSASNKTCRIKDLDLSQSYIEAEVLKAFLLGAEDLESINLTSCRSLPHGCRSIFKKYPDSESQNLTILKKNLGISKRAARCRSVPNV